MYMSSFDMEAYIKSLKTVEKWKMIATITIQNETLFKHHNGIDNYRCVLNR